MADLAEEWLERHDPLYPTSSHAWKDVRSGDYVTPSREIPAGLTADIASLAEHGAPYVDDLAPSVGLCENCGRGFIRTRADRRFCSERCRKRSENRRLYSGGKLRVSRGASNPRNSAAKAACSHADHTPPQSSVSGSSGTE